MARDGSSLFITDRDVAYVNDIATELLEIVALQKVVYYAIEESLTQADDLYGESTRKHYRSPIELYCRVFLSNHSMKNGAIGTENIYEIEVYFQRDRVMNDLGFYPRAGDVVKWNEKNFEIKTVEEPQLFGGLSQHRVGITCKCVILRQDQFNTNEFKTYDKTVIPDSQIRR
jgi:hypothetical protein